MKAARNSGEQPRGGLLTKAPLVPSNFVRRSKELDELRQTVIGDQNTGPIALTALQGMGGIGKTVLASVLCRDEAVQDFFEDGIVWVDIGREPGNLVGQMKRVGQALDDGLGYYDTPEAGADRLQRLLQDKALLLVLDDVWDLRHVDPFIVDAPRCRTLFTTRNADIALRLGARKMQLGVLTPEQAVKLLQSPATPDDRALPEIAKATWLPAAGAEFGSRTAGTQENKRCRVAQNVPTSRFTAKAQSSLDRS